MFKNVALAILISFLHVPILAEDMEVLISGLGSEFFGEREHSANSIRRSGFKAIAHLENHFRDQDLEVALKSKELYEEYMHLQDGDMPSIWFLDPEHRFPEGYNIKFSPNGSICSISCETDVASYYYCEAKRHEISNFIKNRYDLYFNLFDSFWMNPKFCSKAMRMYVRHELRRGRSKKEMKRIVQKTMENMNSNKLIYQTSALDGEVWDYWRCPPGLMIPTENFVFPFR